MKQRKLVDLKKALRKRGLYPRSYLAEVSGIPAATLDSLMSCRMDWKLWQCLKMLELLGEPPCMLTFYFPVKDVKKEPAATDSKRKSA